MLQEMQHDRRQKTMTLLNSNSGYSDASYVREMVRSIGRWLFFLINRWVAALIAERDYQALDQLVLEHLLGR